MRWPVLVDTALAPLGYWSRTRRSAVSLPLALPLLGLVAFFARERRARVDHALELSKAYRGTALLLGDVVEADDAYTGEPQPATSSISSLAVSDRLGALHTSGDRPSSSRCCTTWEDPCPAAIINKPGPLDADERRVIERHTIEGQLMLEKVGGMLGEVGRIVRSCHERWDGRATRTASRGEDTPLITRIVCAATPSAR